MPERTLLGVLARTAHWLEWHRRFSPASGSDSKLRDPFFRYVITNTVIFHTTLDMMTTIRELVADGWEIMLEDLAVLSPYLTARIQRFGVYATDEIALAPEPFDARLGVDLATAS